MRYVGAVLMIHISASRDKSPRPCALLFGLRLGDRVEPGYVSVLIRISFEDDVRAWIFE